MFRNIFIKDDNLKLGTIGLTTLINESIEHPSQTEINVFSYMSPEMLSKHTFDIQTDIWSFGCIMYEVFTLQKAFTSYKVQELIYSVVYGNKMFRLDDSEMTKLLNMYFILILSFL